MFDIVISLGPALTMDFIPCKTADALLKSMNKLYLFGVVLSVLKGFENSTLVSWQLSENDFSVAKTGVVVSAIDSEKIKGVIFMAVKAAL